MTPDEILDSLDELERTVIERVSSEFASFRPWLERVLTGPDGPMLAESFPWPGSVQHSATDGSLLLTLEEAADELRVSMATVKRLIVAGHLPLVKLGRSSRVRRLDLMRLADEGVA